MVLKSPPRQVNLLGVAVNTDSLEEFVRRGQAAQRAIDELTPASYWWHVRLRVIEREGFHLERVCAPNSREACRLASAAAGEKWRGCTFYVVDLVQEGL